MKYDDASWHYGGEFPTDLPEEAAATHTGLFVAWAILGGLGSRDWEDGWFDLESFRARKLSPSQAFLCVDGKFTDEDLSEEGNAFTAEYFDLEKGQYLIDYETTFGADLQSLYHVVDNWENYDRLKDVLDKRLVEWRLKRRGES